MKGKGIPKLNFRKAIKCTFKKLEKVVETDID